MAGYDTILVVDFGGQYAHLISRRLRELGVYTELAYPDEAGDMLEESAGVVLSGGPGSVWEASHDRIVEEVISQGKPVLGICYGHQLLGKILGGRVGPSPKPEFGPTRVRIVEARGVLEGFPRELTVWMSHNDAVLEVPEKVRVLAVSEGSPVAALEAEGLVFGVQWHPEVSHSQLGMKLLENWLKLAGARRGWRPVNLIDELVDYVRRTVGDGVAVAAVSGGVDSTVAAVIAHKALGDRLVPILIDHGFHPDGEVERAVEALTRLGIKPKVVDAADRFFSALEGVADPEEKRKIFGRVYAEVLEEEAKSVGAEFLVQGTIYPDVIESGGRRGADIIKSHHNVGGLPEKFGLKLVEPLRLFYKDEVRKIGLALGLPESLVYKQPVPGPGLAVRVEGPVDRGRVELVRKADRIVREEIERAGLARSLWQYFAILSRSMATGVKGDRRAYGHVIVVRVVESSDAMTASPARLPWEVLEKIASRITGEIGEVTRVVYDVTSKPPATIEWE